MQEIDVEGLQQATTWRYSKAQPSPSKLRHGDIVGHS